MRPILIEEGEGLWLKINSKECLDFNLNAYEMKNFLLFFKYFRFDQIKFILRVSSKKIP